MKNLKSFNYNLQLFASKGDDFVEDEELEDGETNDVADVVDEPEDEVLEDGEEIEDEGEDGEVAEPQKSKQTPEENAKHRKMRLKAEADANKKLQAEKDELEKMKLAFQIEKEAIAEKNKITQDAIWERADSEGISESAAKKLLEAEVENKVSQIKDRFEKVQQQKESLKKDPFYEKISPEMDKVLKEQPNLDPQTVFYYLKGQMGDELYKETVNKTAKTTVANIQDGMRRRNVPSSSGGASDTLSVLSKEGLEMASAFGNDPREIAKYVKSMKKKK